MTSPGNAVLKATVTVQNAPADAALQVAPRLSLRDVPVTANCRIFTIGGREKRTAAPNEIATRYAIMPESSE